VIEMNLEEISRCLKRDLKDYKVSLQDGLYYYPEPGRDRMWILSRQCHSPLPIGDAILIKEKKIFFPKTLIRLLSMDHKEYEAFQSGTNVLYGQGSTKIEEIFPKPTTLILMQKEGRKAYVHMIEEMNSRAYDFATIDMTLK
jgi:hypothetical protein